MDEIKEAIALAMQEFHKEYGEDAKMRDGDEFVAVLNNCTLVVSNKDGEAGFHFIGGKPLKADMSLGIYEDVD